MVVQNAGTTHAEHSAGNGPGVDDRRFWEVVATQSAQQHVSFSRELWLNSKWFVIVQETTSSRRAEMSTTKSIFLVMSIISNTKNLRSAVTSRLRYLQTNPEHLRTFFKSDTTRYAA
jgi:hypothetical protein